MRKVENKIMISKIKRGMVLFGKHGIQGVMKSVRNKRYHTPASKDVIQSVHMVSNDELNVQESKSFSKKIKFSIITPLYNTPENFLRELIESVQRQTYTDWELCFADGSDEEHAYVSEICKEYASKDSRIVYHTLKENKGISENTNECIKLASGDYYGLLDHDDLLHPSALYEVMCAIEEQDAEFIYTDEVKFSDKVEDVDNALAFNLKPGFGKYDLRSHNYICHFTVFNRHLLDDEEVLYRKEYDGSQDHDMVLRLTEKTQKIVHIPKVLYYWRVHKNSVSMDIGTKPYVVDAAIHAVQSQLERQKEKGTVASSLPFQTIYRVKYEIEGKPLISIVIINAKTNQEVKTAVQNILEYTTYRPLEIIYNSSTNIEMSVEKGVDLLKVNCSGEKGEVWDYLIQHMTGQYILLYDWRNVPDMSTWLEEMLMYAQKSDVCTVGSKIYYPDDSICFAGISLDAEEDTKLKYLCDHDSKRDIGYEALLCHVRNTTMIDDVCAMFSKDTWQKLGGFQTSVKEYEMEDFCLRGLQRGMSNVWTAYAELHYQGKERISKKSAQNISKFSNKWDKAIREERYLHPYWKRLGLV